MRLFLPNSIKCSLGFEGTFDAITEVKGKDADGKIKSNSEFENKAEEIIRGMVNKYLTKKKQRKNPKSNSKSKSSDETIANVLENVRK
jgi:hypothetical protein